MSRIAIASLSDVSDLSAREMRETNGGLRLCVRWIRLGRLRFCTKWVNIPLLRIPKPKLPIPDPGPLAGIPQ